MTGIPGHRRAWVTLLTKPEYVAGVLVLHRTLQAVSKFPLVVMITASLPEAYRDILHAYGLETVDVAALKPPIGQHPGFEAKFARFDDVWTKLAVFGLAGYDRAILIDADMIFLRSMDELFDLELPAEDWIAAAPACICNPLRIADYPSDWVPSNCLISSQSRYEALDKLSIPDPSGPRTSHLLNSGLVVLQPSARSLDRITHFLATSPTIAAARFADQDVIATAFFGKWRPLPWWCNALKTERAVHPQVWHDMEVRLIHYILDKPWDTRPRTIPKTIDVAPATLDNSAPQGLPQTLVSLVRSSPAQESVTQYDAVHLWWWSAYIALIGEMKAVHPDNFWQSIDRWIAQ